ncbi:hypothetical protein Pyn_33978 [Prunus yedoensis var. nudiflora]|uniref:Uncharacterized protein n=1 Tax=Prunus yedoensis var. nudiflora TaxID=2094558 RepID=A0A314UB49_PRUYE|nr:hypothetical protein Pyn_33978 [Prunus yedoensis var. nudiflora]
MEQPGIWVFTADGETQSRNAKIQEIPEKTNLFMPMSVIESEVTSLLRNFLTTRVKMMHAIWPAGWVGEVKPVTWIVRGALETAEALTKHMKSQQARRF